MHKREINRSSAMFQLYHKAFTQLKMGRFIPRLFSACAAILGHLLNAEHMEYCIPDDRCNQAVVC